MEFMCPDSSMEMWREPDDKLDCRGHDRYRNYTEHLCDPNTFPYGNAISAIFYQNLAFGNSESGDTWVELGGSDPPHFVRLEDLAVRDSLRLPPSQSFRCAVGWNAWVFTDTHPMDYWTYLEECSPSLWAALRICASAPPPVVGNLGNLSGFADWPSALFYLAAKDIHPSLSVGYYRCGESFRPKFSPQSEASRVPFGSCTDLWFYIKPKSVLAATRHAFDGLRHIASGAGSTAGGAGGPSGTADLQDGGQNAKAPDEGYVTLSQAAAIVNRSKRTLEKHKTKMPPPCISDGGGKPDEWLWSGLRPWLEGYFGRKLPDRFPADKFRKE